MKDGQIGGTIASWSAHHIPPGSSVRYVLNTGDDDAAIRLIIGDLEQVELEMALPEVKSIVTALQDAEQDARTRNNAPGPEC